jgi:hypothetical protein
MSIACFSEKNSDKFVLAFLINHTKRSAKSMVFTLFAGEQKPDT